MKRVTGKSHGEYFALPKARIIGVCFGLLIAVMCLVAPLSAQGSQAAKDFQEAVLTRCLPAVLTDSRVNKSGLTKLTNTQKKSLLGGTPELAFFVGKRAVLVLSRSNRRACQVGVYGVDPTELKNFPERWLLGGNAPFKELSQRPKPNVRVFTAQDGISVVFAQRPALTLISAVRKK